MRTETREQRPHHRMHAYGAPCRGSHLPDKCSPKVGRRFGRVEVDSQMDEARPLVVAGTSWS